MRKNYSARYVETKTLSKILFDAVGQEHFIHKYLAGAFLRCLG